MGWEGFELTAQVGRPENWARETLAKSAMESVVKCILVDMCVLARSWNASRVWTVVGLR